MRKAEKSLRPQRLSGEKGLPQRRRDAEGMAPAAYFAKAAKARERGPTEQSVDGEKAGAGWRGPR